MHVSATVLHLAHAPRTVRVGRTKQCLRATLGGAREHLGGRVCFLHAGGDLRTSRGGAQRGCSVLLVRLWFADTCDSSVER